MRVLFLDHDAELLAVLKEILEGDEFNWKVTISKLPLDLDGVVKLATQAHADLIVWDIKPPYQDNYDYFQRMRRHPKLARWPMLALTTAPPPIATVEKDIDVVLYSPLRIRDLTNAIELAWRKYHDQKYHT